MIAWIHPVAFHVGSWPVYWYGLIIGVGMLCAYQLITYLGKKENISEEWLLDFMFWSILIGFIGARLYYVVFQWDYYFKHLEQIVQIWHGGLAIYGGVIAGSITAFILSKKRHLDPWRLFDVAAPGLLLAQGIGRWGNFINQEAYGGKVDLSFLQKLHLPQWLIEQMFIEGHYHHPTFLYESVWSILGVILLLFISHQNKRYPGKVACSYFVWYGLGRMVIEGMRTDSLYLGPLRISQWVSVALIIAGLFIMKQKRSNNLYT